jgi:pilus assembly protein Flp/PilA
VRVRCCFQAASAVARRATAVHFRDRGRRPIGMTPSAASWDTVRRNPKTEAEITAMTASIIALFRQLRRDERGVSAMEYGILAAAIVTGVVAATTVLGGYISTTINSIGTAIGG